VLLFVVVASETGERTKCPREVAVGLIGIGTKHGAVNLEPYWTPSGPPIGNPYFFFQKIGASDLNSWVSLDVTSFAQISVRHVGVPRASNLCK